MALGFGAGSGGRGLGSRALLRETLRLLLARKGPMLAVLLSVNIVFDVAAQYLAPLAQAPTTSALIHWSYEVLAAAVTALITAFSLRLLLAPHTRWWRIDRSLAEGVLLLTLAGLAGTAAMALGRAWHRTPFELANELSIAVPIWWFLASMMLWPVGVLLEDREMLQAQAVKQMRGNIRSYVVAYLLLMAGAILLALLIVGLQALAMHMNPKALAAQFRLPMGVVFGMLSIASTALWAALYQSRKDAIPAVDLRTLRTASA